MTLAAMVLITFLFSGSAYNQLQGDSGITDIFDAVQNKKVELKISGAGISAVEITLTKTSPQGEKILIPDGTLFSNKRQEQDMISAESCTIDLEEENTTSLQIIAVCANFYKTVPDSSSDFKLSQSEKYSNAVKIINTFQRTELSHEVLQTAVWIVTDDISRSQLDQRYRKIKTSESDQSEPAVTDIDVIKALELVEVTGIHADREKMLSEKVSLLKGLGYEETWEYAAKALYLNGKDRGECILNALESGYSDLVADECSFGRVKVMNCKVVTALLYQMGWQGDKRAIEPLMPLARDGDSMAAMILGCIKDPKIIHPLMQGLRNTYSRSHKKNRTVTQTLVNQLLVEQNSIFYFNALKNLGIIAADSLINALSDPDKLFADILREILIEMGDPAISPIINRIQYSDADSMLMVNYFSILGAIGSASVEAITGCLDHDKPNVRSMAVFALGQIGDSLAVDALYRKLKDEDPVVRENAAKALAKIKNLK